jgi:regulator of RNase E activity RraA
VVDHPAELLEDLRGFTTPTIANAIETFRCRPRTEGYTDDTIRCVVPGLGVGVAYAVTARLRSSDRGPRLPGAELYRLVGSVPGPRIVVVEELDRPAVGAWWGEVHGNVFQNLGCVGVLTNGAVRDLTELQELGFHALAGSVSVSHAYAHLVEVGAPVTVGGLTVATGDVLHFDQHGACSIPEDLVGSVADAARAVEASEQAAIRQLQGGPMDPDAIAALFRRPDPRD